MLQKLNFDFYQDKSVKEKIVTLQEEDGFNLLMTNPVHDFWKQYEHGPQCVFYVKELEPGVYCTGLNFEHSIEQYSDFKAIESYEHLNSQGFPQAYPGNSMLEYFDNTVESYGVADNIEQIKEFYKNQVASLNPIVVSVTEVNKKDQPQHDGWRWSKWGQYIGVQNRQCEYIYDEPNIESVYVFQVYAVQAKI